MKPKGLFFILLIQVFCWQLSAQQDTLSAEQEVLKSQQDSLQSQQDTLQVPLRSMDYTYINEDGLEKKGKLKIGQNLKGEMQKLIDSLYKEGHWNASIDSLFFEENSAQIYKGDVYNSFILNRGNLTEEVYNDLKMFRVKRFEDWPVYGERLMNHLGDLGYPFAQIKLDSIHEQGEDVYGSINLIKGPQIRYDSIYWTGDLRIRPGYMMNYLQIGSGEVYRHADIVNVEKLLRALPFAKLKDSPKLKFIGEYASLHFEIDKKNASRFDFLVGVNPLKEANEETRFFITLDVQAELANQLNYGESIRFRYSRLRPENQELELSARYPYLLDQPIALEGNFGLYRRSLDFQDLEADFGGDYIINTNSSIGIAWTYLSSRLINIDSTGILNRGRLPENLDVVRNGLAISYDWNKLDQLLNPTKGWDVELKIGASTKEIVENDAIKKLKNETYDFSTSFDSLTLVGYQFAIEANVERYFPIGQNFAIKTFVDSKFLLSNLEIYQNELSRIGGNKLLRGFDEESVLGQAYVVPGAAFHVILDEFSFLSLPFVDYGFVKTLSGEWTQALGVGAGINFSTRAGMLNFSIAAGKLGDDPFDIGRPKVHIGFLRLF